MIRIPALAGPLCLVLAACAQTAPGVARFAEPELTSTKGPPPHRVTDPDACHSRDDTPAVVETVTEHLVVQPPEIASDGTVLRPAIYRTLTRQQIVEGREEIWFETPCPEALTPDFVTTLQRALAARGLYQGAPSGEIDRATRAAIRKFQARQGLNSGVLSTAAAKRLGLVIYDRDEALAEG